MKYLKKFLENNEDYNLYGLTPEDVKDMFMEIQDEGWNIRVDFSKKLFQLDQSGLFNKEDFKLGLRPQIKVKIKKIQTSFSTTRQSNLYELSGLLQSELFRETTSVANDRLKTFGWECKDVKIEEDYIIISISKINI